MQNQIQIGEWVRSKNLDLQTRIALRIQPNTLYQVIDVDTIWLRLKDADEDWWISSHWFDREDEFVRKLRTL